VRHGWGEKGWIRGGREEEERRGPKKKREAMQQPTDFLAGLFRPILHKIITLLRPTRFLFRLYLSLLPFSFLSIY